MCVLNYAFKVLASDPGVVWIDLEDGTFLTDMEPRECEESTEEYYKRIRCTDEYIAGNGLRASTIETLQSEGYNVILNDCEGCENEGAVVFDDEEDPYEEEDQSWRLQA